MHYLGLGEDGDVRHVRDGGQRLAAKAERCDRAEIFESLQLGGGEALAHNLQVFLPDAVPIVLDLD